MRIEVVRMLAHIRRDGLTNALLGDRRIQVGLIGSVFLYLCAALINNVSDVGGSQGAADYYSYWYSGILVRVGIDPYSSWKTGEPIPAKVDYLIGSSDTRASILKRNRKWTPANTAPMTLLLRPMSFFSWNYAKYIWMVINLVLAIVFAFTLVEYAERSGLLLSRFLKTLFVLGSLCAISTRACIGNGQTTIVILLCSVIVLASKRRDAVANVLLGLLAGIAFSKYSLSLPLLVMLVLQRRFWVLAISAVTQGGAAAVVAGFTDHDLPGLAHAYVSIARFHERLVGINPANLSYIVDGHLRNLVNAVAFAGASFCAVWIWLALRRIQRDPSDGTPGFLLFAALSAWSLLIVYHRGYDAMAILPAAYAFASLTFREPGQASYRTTNRLMQRTTATALAFLLFVQLLPGTEINRVYSGWTQMQDALVSASICVSLLALVFVARANAVSAYLGLDLRPSTLI